MASERADAALRGTVFNFINAMVGAGVLALPFNASLEGIAVVLVMLAFVGWLAERTSVMILWATDATSGRSYSQVAQRAFNRVWVGVLVDVTITLMTFGIMTSYVVFLGELVPDVLHTFGLQGWYTSAWFTRTAIGVVVLWPLSLLPTMKPLRFTSMMSLTCIGIFVLMLVVETVYKIVSPQHALPIPADEDTLRFVPASGRSFLNSVAVVVYSYVGHQNLPILYRQLRHKQRWLSRGSVTMDMAAQASASGNMATNAEIALLEGAEMAQTPRLAPGELLATPVISKWSKKRGKMKTAVRYALASAFGVYSTAGVCGYFLLRGLVTPNVLQAFLYKDFKFIVFIKLTYAVALMCGYPVQSMGCRESVQQLLYRTSTTPAATLSPGDPLQTRSEVPYWVSALVATLTTGLAIVVGIYAPNVQVVFGLTGSITATNVMFTYPALMYLRVRSAGPASHRTKWTSPSMLLAMFVMVFGAFVCVAGTTSILLDLGGS